MVELREKNLISRKNRAVSGRCPVCQNENARFLFARNQDSFVRCGTCGLIYQDPPPSGSGQRAFYESEYYQNLSEFAQALQEARRPLYDKFLGQCRSYRRTGRLLDIGAGYGDFLGRARQKGWKVWGIEPSLEACQAARERAGQDVLNQTLEDVRFPENYFDIITLWNVVDCLPDPRQAMRQIFSWLRPGGLLMIRTPNAFFHCKIYGFYNRFRPYLERAGCKKDPSVFLGTNFDAKAVRHLLAGAGFSEVRIHNGGTTKGDPYKITPAMPLITAMKFILSRAASAVNWLTARKVFIGSNLLIYASKKAEGQGSAAKAGENADRPAPLDGMNRKIRARIYLKSFFLHLLAVFGYLLGLPLWSRLLGGRHHPRILLYHSVGENIFDDMNVAPREFEKQMKFLRDHYQVLSLREAVKAVKTEPVDARPPVAVTFDDGYENNYRVAFPLLKKFGLSAAFFLLTGGREKDRSTPHLKIFSGRDARLLEWDQIREMARGGMIFGSHGQTHSRLKERTEDELTLEVSESKKKIEAEVGSPVEFFSYPYGTREDFDFKTMTAVRQAGYAGAFSAVFGANGHKENTFALKRMGVEASDTLFTFRAKLNGALNLLLLFHFAWIKNVIRRFDRMLLKDQPEGRRFKTSPILLVSVDFPPHADGVSTLAREISARMGAKEKPLLVICPRDRRAGPFDLLQPYQTLRVPGYGWGYLRFIPLLFCVPWAVFRYRIREILAMNIAYGGVLCWLLSFFRPLDYVLFAYGYEFEKVKRAPVLKKLYQKIYARAKAVIACSREVRSRLAAFGVSEEKIHVLYPAADLSRYKPCEVPAWFLEKYRLSDRRIILTVGRLIERKGHDAVLRAMPKIVSRFPDILYLITGEGAQKKRLLELTKAINIEQHVRFLGRIPDEEVPYLYNACDVFVMPSREMKRGGHIEGFGIVFLEANACGKPVIAGKSGGVLEAVRDAETGYLVNPDSPDEIADKVLELLSDPGKAQAMGRRGSEWVRENFDWDDYEKNVERLLSGGSLR